MFMKLFVAGSLVVVTVAIHAVGFSALLRAIMRWQALSTSGSRPVTGLVIGVTCWLVLIHMAEIGLWGAAYWWWGCMPDVESAVYFSGVTYTTLGFDRALLRGRQSIHQQLDSQECPARASRRGADE